MSRFAPLAAILTAFLLYTAAASASTSAPVSFHLEGSATAFPTGPFSGRTEGIFSATGGVSDSGSFVDRFFIANGTLHVERMFITAAGVITMDLQGRFVAASGTTETVQGSWTIPGGTGAYARLRGTGSFTSTVDTATETFSEDDTGSADSD